MIDLKLLREDPGTIRTSQVARGADPSLVDRAVAADREHREALARFETLRAQQKSYGKRVAAAQGPEKQQLLAEVTQLKTDVKDAERVASEMAQQLDDVLRRIPNVVAPGVPAGGEDDYEVLREVGTVRDFAAEGVAVRDHLDIGESLRMIDTQRGVKVSGARFYFLTGMGARLELALLNLAMDVAMRNGFTPMITPTLVLPTVMGGTGFLGSHADEVYHLEADDLYLVGTSEVPLAGYHSDEVIDLSAGPLKYAGWSPCYRREAGSYGKDTRGIIRVHQFQKVEMFVYAAVEEAEAIHRQLLALEEEMLAAVELPYRVIHIAAGDLGSSAARKYDCEAWLPSQSRWLELTSTSNCTTFQSRRLGIRERTDGANRPVATLNGTMANTRWLVALLENHQQSDGSVRIPTALQPYLGGLASINP